jgi:hypothetical protein
VIRRREFITLIGGAAAWPLGAHAEQPTMPVVGFLRSTSSADSVHLVGAFGQGLRAPERRHYPILDQSAFLQTFLISTNLIVPHSCPFVRFVTANNATCRRANDAMMTSEMACSTAHDSTL